MSFSISLKKNLKDGRKEGRKEGWKEEKKERKKEGVRTCVYNFKREHDGLLGLFTFPISKPLGGNSKMYSRCRLDLEIRGNLLPEDKYT